MRFKSSLKRLNGLACCAFGILVFISLSQVKCTDTNDTTTTTTTTTSTTTTAIKWDTCNIGKGSKREQDLLANLTAIKGKKFVWSDDEHQYFFTVCGKADNADDVDQGFVQVNKQTKRKFVLGRLDDVDLEGILEGKSKFIRLTYKNGDDYAGSCGKTSRNAIVYIFCDNKDDFKMIEENNGRDNNQCGYVFQLYSQLMCPYLFSPCDQSATTTTSATPPLTTPSKETSNSTSSANTTVTSASSSSKSPSTPSKMGFFAILLIILLSILSVYLVVGTLFKRYVRQARGWEQIPNWRMWQIIGNRSMDCCNYICRCGKPRTEPNAYENIIDHTSDDENLLNM